MTGVLAPAQVTDLNNMSANAGWAPSVTALLAKPAADDLFDNALSDVFNPADKQTLLAPDVVVAAANIQLNLPDPNTAPGKRLFFLSGFMPFLRRRLGQQLIVQTLSGTGGLDTDLTQTLLQNILVVGGQSALNALLALAATPPGPPPANWDGYLIAPATDG